MDVDAVVKAVVQKVVSEGRHGPFAVATSDGLDGSVTFSLERTIWKEKEWPEEGMYVLLGKLRQKRAGWRAKAGRFFKPSDEQTERSKCMSEENVRLVTSAGLKEVPADFDLAGYVGMRAEQERTRRQELEREYGEEIPLRCFGSVFVSATIEVLLNMKESHPDAFGALVAKLRNPQAQISDELSRQIAIHGTFLIEQDDGTYGVDVLVQSLFREAQKLSGGFESFIGAMLAQRHNP